MNKKSRRLICFVPLLLAVISLPIFAHSGRTDGAGGHTNHSTGEYHYHHGYDDHQHYDMDGDGIADCPYNFKSDTIQKDRNSSDSTTSFSEKKRANKVSFSVILGVVVFGGLALLYLSPIITWIYESVRDLIHNLKKRH